MADSNAKAQKQADQNMVALPNPEPGPAPDYGHQDDTVVGASAARTGTAENPLAPGDYEAHVAEAQRAVQVAPPPLETPTIGEPPRVAQDIPADRIVYDANGRLTLDSMKHVLNQGGSVLHRGTIRFRPQDLPDEVELAQGDANRLSALSDELDAEIARLQSRKAAVAAAQGSGRNTNQAKAGE